MTRYLSNRVVGAKEEKEKGKELSGVHPVGVYLAQAKIKKHDYSSDADNVDQWRRDRGQAAGTPVCLGDHFGDPRETRTFARLGMIGLDDSLIGKGFLGGVG